MTLAYAYALVLGTKVPNPFYQLHRGFPAARASGPGSVLIFRICSSPDRLGEGMMQGS